MNDPILQDRRQEHVAFQKYAVELMERVSGKTAGSQLEVSLANIYKVCEPVEYCSVKKCSFSKIIIYLRKIFCCRPV